MKEIFENQPLSSEAPQGLRNKVEFESRQRGKRNVWARPPMRFAAIGTAVAAAAIGGVMFLTPANAEAKTWDMVTAAYQEVRGVLIQMTFAGDGENGSLTVAGKGGDWRVSFQGDGENTDISYSGGELTIWDGGDTAQVINLGINIPFSPEDVMKGMTEQLTASKIFEEHADEIGRDNIRIEQPKMVDGRSVYNVYITEPNGEGTVHILVDAETDLPISMSVEGPKGEEMRMSFRFNTDFDSSLLRPVLPSGIKFEHHDGKGIMEGDGGDFFRGLEGIGKEFGKMHDGHHEDNDGPIEGAQVRIQSATLRG